MKHTSLYLALILALSLLMGGSRPAQAQSDDLQTTLARSTAQSFLTALTRDDLDGVLDFYLLDSLNKAEILEALQATPVEAYTIIESGWASEVTYRVEAELLPAERSVIVYTGKYDGRWRVEGVDVALPPARDADVTTVPVADAPSGPPPIEGNGSGQLVFMTQSGGDIYYINADGTDLQRITHGLDPHLSPDGSRIAFTRWEPRYELFTINVDGSDEQAITHGWRQMKSPTWTADGEKIVFSYQDGGRLEAEQRDISLENYIEEHGEPPRVPSNAVGVEVENGILEYTIPADAYWYLREVDLSTGHIELLPVERHAYGPTGHPTDGSRVIYKGQQGLALHNLAEERDTPVTGDFRDHTPVISPDGSKVAVSYWQHGHWEVHVVNLDGSGRTRLTETPITELANNQQLVTANVAGKERVVAPENPHWNNAAPTWSPDGSQIAFLTDRTGEWEIWIMNADGSNQRPMFANGALDGIALEYNGVDERMLSWR